MQANESPISPPRLYLRILLAEGSVSPQTILERMLGELGHTVVRVHSGTEVLSFLDQQFDLVLIDLRATAIEGMQAVAAIRAQEIVMGGHVSVIGMSAVTKQSDRKHCLAAGMDRYTSKPLNKTDLQTILLASSNPDAIRQTKRPAEWDRTSLLERAGGNEKAFSNLVALFVSEKENLLADMNRALVTRQSELLERTALQLGEELNYLGIFELAYSARELAASGRRRDFLKAGELVVGLQSRLCEMDAIMTRRDL